MVLISLTCWMGGLKKAKIPGNRIPISFNRIRMRQKKVLCLYIALFAILIFPAGKIPAQGNPPARQTPGTAGSTGPDGTNIGTTLDLRQAISIAIKNNLLVNQSDLLMQGSKVSFNQARENMLPYIGASGSQGISFGRSLNPYTYTYVDQQINTGSYGISTNLTLFSGLQLQNAIKQNSYAYQASKMDLQQQKDNIALNVLLAYLQVLSSQDLLAIARAQAEVDARQLERLDKQNNEGALLLLSNLSDIKGQYAGDQVNIAAAANSVETAKVSLFQLLNIPYKRDVEFDRTPISLQLSDYLENPDSLYQTALHTMPMIQAADLRIKSYQKGLQSVRGQYYPTLSFYGNINTSYSNAATVDVPSDVTNVTTKNYVTVGGTNYNVVAPQQNYNTQSISFPDQFRNNRYTSIGLQLNIPILSYLRTRNNVKQAKLNLKNAEVNANSTRLVLQQNVELAYQNMIAAYSQYKSYIEQAAAYSESFRTAEIRFNEGVINSDIYVLAKNNADRANTSLSQAKYIYIFRTKVLDFYQGRLSW